MKVSHIVLFGALLAFAGSAAAFQEQRQGAPAPAPTAAPQVDQPAVAAPVAPQGTEVRVPGFGKLGVLPKIDFGLELLYGSSEQQRAQSTAPAVDPTDGMAVRGSFKHKF